MINVTDLKASDFQGKKLNTDGPALVFFYASWCGHCKNFAPSYQKVADIIGGVYGTYRADIDKTSAVADALGIKAVPTVVFFPEDSGEPRVYNGDMTWRGLLNFMNRKDSCGI